MFVRCHLEFSCLRSQENEEMCHPERAFQIRGARSWAQQSIQARVEQPALSEFAPADESNGDLHF